MTLDWTNLSWPQSELAQGLVALARALRWPVDAETAHLTTPPGLSARQLEEWLGALAGKAGLHLAPTDCAYPELHEVLPKVAPALVRVSLAEESRYLVVLSSGRGRARLLTRTLERRSVDAQQLRALLWARFDGQADPIIQRWLSSLGVGQRRQTRARRALQQLLFERQRIDGLYPVRVDARGPFFAQIAGRGGVKLAASALLLSVLQVGLSSFGWLILGQGAAAGYVERGWLSAWALCLLSAAGLQALVTWFSGATTHELSLLLKQRLLAGALQLEPDQVRSRGSGRLLALVFEAAALETAGLTGAVQLSIALVQLTSAAVVIWLGAGGAWGLLLLLGWCVTMSWLVRRYERRRVTWSEERIDLARSFVENVVGYRTRIIQQPAARWHEREVADLNRYVATSANMDQAQNRLAALPARGWLVLGIAGLIPVLLSETPARAELTIALAGILQAHGALLLLAREGVNLCGASVAWTRVRELFRAGRQRPERLPSAFSLTKLGAGKPAAEPTQRTIALDLRGVSFGHAGSNQALLRDCSLRLHAGEHTLLEGASGSGKSTLAALIAGLREPQSGAILAHGFDRATLGLDGWLRRVATAPQFHENYLFGASLAFNLLMGRGWPASETDLEAALDVCRALGLGPLLTRMPSGIQQIVGETGWQLSHGERSRVFLARALLQGAPLVILDETLAALDPLTLRQCIDAALARARTLLVIAHP